MNIKTKMIKFAKKAWFSICFGIAKWFIFPIILVFASLETFYRIRKAEHERKEEQKREKERRDNLVRSINLNSK